MLAPNQQSFVDATSHICYKEDGSTLQDVQHVNIGHRMPASCVGQSVISVVKDKSRRVQSSIGGLPVRRLFSSVSVSTWVIKGDAFSHKLDFGQNLIQALQTPTYLATLDLQAKMGSHQKARFHAMQAS